MVMCSKPIAAKLFWAALTIAVQLVIFVLEIDTDTKTGRPAVEQVPVMEALLVVTSKIVE